MGSVGPGRWTRTGHRRPGVLGPEPSWRHRRRRVTDGSRELWAWTAVGGGRGRAAAALRRQRHTAPDIGARYGGAGGCRNAHRLPYGRADGTRAATGPDGGAAALPQGARPAPQAVAVPPGEELERIRPATGQAWNVMSSRIGAPWNGRHPAGRWRSPAERSLPGFQVAGVSASPGRNRRRVRRCVPVCGSGMPVVSTCPAGPDRWRTGAGRRRPRPDVIRSGVSQWSAGQALHLHFPAGSGASFLGPPTREATAAAFLLLPRRAQDPP